MRETLAVKQIGVLLLSLSLVLLAGCPPRKGPVAPPPPLLPVDQAVAMVNANVAAIPTALSDSNITVSAAFHDENDKVRRYDLTGKLRFKPPRNLFLDLGHTLEPSAMRIGSNDEQFWVWVKPERNELWYGRWADLDPTDVYGMPLSPDMILAAMGLSALPGPGSGLRGPIPQTDDGQYYKMLYLARTPAGALWIQREYWLDRAAPYLPRVVVFRLEDGQVRMRATLDRYERVGNSTVYIARQIRMEWPEQGDSLSMRMGRLTFKEVPAEAFRLDEKRTPIPRDHWIAVGRPPRPAAPASAPAASESAEAPGSMPVASEPAAAPGSAPAASEPAGDLELESSPE